LDSTSALLVPYIGVIERAELIRKLETDIESIKDELDYFNAIT
jgi:hypothetical protein